MFFSSIYKRILYFVSLNGAVLAYANVVVKVSSSFSRIRTNVCKICQYFFRVWVLSTHNMNILRTKSVSVLSVNLGIIKQTLLILSLDGVVCKISDLFICFYYQPAPASHGY